MPTVSMGMATVKRNCLSLKTMKLIRFRIRKIPLMKYKDHNKRPRQDDGVVLCYSLKLIEIRQSLSRNAVTCEIDHIVKLFRVFLSVLKKPLVRVREMVQIILQIRPVVCGAQV